MMMLTFLPFTDYALHAREFHRTHHLAVAQICLHGTCVLRPLFLTRRQSPRLSHAVHAVPLALRQVVYLRLVAVAVVDLAATIAADEVCFRVPREREL